MINWIAEITVDNAKGWKQGGWNRQVRARGLRPPLRRLELGLARRADDARGANEIFEYPMIDRDPGAHLGGRPGGALWATRRT